ncbi:ATP-binding protein, partial [Streptomyces sp. MP131-18]|uniref:ATP-binding protein n=1 Tax=Streptomyces sp. MP131-18 TaxID=1857892 RepID=UPI00209A89FF
MVTVFERWDAPPHCVEVARLGVSELLTNVAKHAGTGRCYLRLLRIGPEAVVQVHDRSRTLPVITEPDREGEDGRGLWLLREMADRLGCEVTHRRHGKIVWFSCVLSQ